MADMICIMLIVACVIGVIYMIFNIRGYWIRNEEKPLQEKAAGIQIRMTIIPVLLVSICVLVLIMKQF